MLSSIHLATDPLGRTFAQTASPVSIDLRDANSFERQHVKGFVSLPLSTLEERLFEMPPPGEWPVRLLGSRSELDEAHELLRPKGWSASEIDVDAEPTWYDTHTTAAGTDDGPPSPYRPNSFLHAALDALGADLTPDGQHGMSSGLAIDLGCGSGRDAVHIASALTTVAPRWHTIGIDNHVAALERGKQLARRYYDPRPSGETGAAASTTLEGRVSFEAADLRKKGLEAVLEARPDEPLRLVHGCRWLHLPLLAKLPDLLAPGGLVMWSTFLDPPDGSEPLAPPFRRSRRLSSGQMRELLGEAAGMEVVYDGEGELLTRGKWISAQFYCARKRD